ncbi:hypothetical protein B296_00009871 [Ensete ventricosum]|uniref:Uncharacterized protein n=1 Tax=Ensete ventricosum TaxID=4639 RepID=A0A427AT95_ENSVE|nr:hypothetical protein B296_00009871 [Ensete ventricosum]
MAKHHGKSSKMGQVRPLPQAAVGGLQLDILRERRRRNLVRQLGKGATKRDLQKWKPASMFLKRAWRNSTKGNEDSLG